MNRREFIKLVAVSGFAGTAGTVLGGCTGNEGLLIGHRRSKGKKPNFIIIFCDDQGYADVGCFGAEGFETPNLDRMAAEGVRFTDFYVGSSICGPSRAALMTGCYPQRVSMASNLSPNAERGLNPKETTIAKLLKTRGYATACYGKWHLGDNPKFLPTRHGFDEYFGIPYSNDMSAATNTSIPLAQHWPPLPLMHNEKVIELEPDQTKLTTWYTEWAIKFIEENRDRPFFVYLPHAMPHIPLHVSDKFKGKSKRGMYGDVIMEIDWSAGQILKTLKKLGLDEDTLVIFTSDNGPWLRYGDYGGSAKPLREGKATTFEGGQREPCIMRWPGKIPAGKVSGEPVAAMDILPTLAKLSGAKLPRNRIDGKNIWPLMSGQAGAKSPHEALFYYMSGNLQAVRCGKWKLHLPHRYRSVVETGSGGKAGRYAFKEIELSLFDLEKDISEQHDVSAEHPDVVERLMALADKMSEDLGDTARKIKGKNIRPAGHI